MSYEVDYSKRAFIFGLVGAAGGVLLNHAKRDDVFAATLNPTFLEDADLAGQWQRYMRDQYSVVFHDPLARIDELLLPEVECGDPLTYERSISWDVDRLKLFDEAFSSLPSGLYTPSITPDGVFHHLGVSLVDRPFNSIQGKESRRSKHKKFPTGEHLLLFSPSRLPLDQDSQDESKRRIVHEVVHYRTSQNLPFYIEGICYPLDIGDIDSLREVFDAELKTVVEEELDDCGNPTGEIREKLKHKSSVGYGAMTFGEFFSVASEFYYQGEEKFIRIYKPFFEKKGAERFYGLIKDHLFDSYEYGA